MAFGFILNQGLELLERPSVKTAPYLFPCPYPLPDVRQIFHDNRTYLCSYSLLNNLFAHFMIYMLNTTSLFTRDFLQQLFCRLRTVGLQAAPLGQKFISLVADVSSTKELSTAQRSKNIFTDIYAHYTAICANGLIRQIQNQIEIPFTLFTDQFSFFRNSLIKMRLLKQAHFHFNANSSLQGVKGKKFSLNRVSSFIKMDTPIFVKMDRWNRLAFKNGSALVSLADRKNSVTNHLGAELRRAPYFGITKIMQSYPIPASMFNSKRNNTIACHQKSVLQVREQLRLVFSCLKLYANGTFHRAKNYANILFYLQPRLEERRFLPVLKDRVSAPSKG